MSSSKPKPGRYIEEEIVPAWIMYATCAVAVLIAILVAFSVYTDIQQRARSAAAYNCGLQYERDTPQWQNCMDDQ